MLDPAGGRPLHETLAIPLPAAAATALWPVPAAILWLYAADVGLGASYVANVLLGEPSYQLTQWLDLDGEQNIPTWYSSMQWFLAAALLGLFAQSFTGVGTLRRFLLVALPLTFLAMSLDEVAGIHEWLGVKSDALLPDGDRTASVFSANGIWVLVIGVPVAAFLGLLLYSLREHFRAAPAGFYMIVAGLGLAFFGALAFEMLLNFIPRHGRLETLSELCEEMLEMIGATTVVWGAYILVSARARTRRS